MSLRIRFVVPVIFSALALLAGCGSSNPPVTPPPTGSFSNSNLNGTYVFSASGTDANGDPYAIAGTLTANGSGGITGGAIDLSDPAEFSPQANVAIGSGSSYSVGVDGRGLATLNTSTGFGTITLAFVLQDSSHGLVIEFDQNATGSGTLDVQTAGTTPTGTYAFSLSGANTTGDLATVGNFTVGSSGSISGLQDYTNNTLVYSNLALSGTLSPGPLSSPSTTLITSPFPLTFDAIPIDATHLKFIEMDGEATLSGDAYSQTSASMPVGTLPFTLGGAITSSLEPTVAGGFMVTDNSGDITNASAQDINEGATTINTAPVTFTGNYVASGTGRYQLTVTDFQGASQFVAYPSSAGLFLLQNDSQGILSGIAYPAQTSTTFSSAQGYGLNLSGVNIAAEEELDETPEIDDIAEFTAASSGDVTGYLDENCMPGCPSVAVANISLGTTSTFATPTNGRGQIGTGNNSINTLNGGFLLTYYTVDGTTVPFIEQDDGQVALGVMFVQNAGSSADALAKASAKHLYVPAHMLKSRKALQRKK